MIYFVSGDFIFEKAHEFLQRLNDGSIEQQKPDGPEIVRAMRSATIDDSGVVNWTEECFCPIPLMHERTTVYDLYFSNLETTVIPKHERPPGTSFIAQLSSFATNSR